MNDMLILPCESCITKAICKNKEIIFCSLLLESYELIKHNRHEFRWAPFLPDRVIENLLSGIFNWDCDLIVVIKHFSTIEVITPNSKIHNIY